MTSLNERQLRFVELCIEYETNNTKAYQTAYNIPDDKKASARAKASELLSNVNIRDLVQQGIAAKKKRREKLREKAEIKAITHEIASKEECYAILTKIARGHAPYTVQGKLIMENKRDMMAAASKLIDALYTNDGGAQGNITINITNGTANGNKIEKYDSEPDDD